MTVKQYQINKVCEVAYKTATSLFMLENSLYTKRLRTCQATVYGYTATSAQHISKFFKDYGNDITPANTYRP